MFDIPEYQNLAEEVKERTDAIEDSYPEEAQEKVMGAILKGEDNIRQTADLFAPYLGSDYESYLDGQLKAYKVEISRIESSLWTGDYLDIYGPEDVYDDSLVNNVIEDILNDFDQSYPEMEEMESRFFEMAKDDPLTLWENAEALGVKWFASDVLIQAAALDPLMAARYCGRIKEYYHGTTVATFILKTVCTSNFSESQQSEVLDNLAIDYPGVVLRNVGLYKNSPFIESVVFSALINSENAWSYSIERFTNYLDSEKMNLLAQEQSESYFWNYKLNRDSGIADSALTLKALEVHEGAWYALDETLDDIKNDPQFDWTILSITQRDPLGFIPFFKENPNLIKGHTREKCINLAALGNPDHFLHNSELFSPEELKAGIDELILFSEYDVVLEHFDDFKTTPFAEEVLLKIAERRPRRVIHYAFDHYTDSEGEEHSILGNGFDPIYKKVFTAACEELLDSGNEYNKETVRNNLYVLGYGDTSLYLQVAMQFPTSKESILLAYALGSRHLKTEHIYEQLSSDEALEDIYKMRHEWFEDMPFREFSKFAVMICRNLYFQEKPINQINSLEEYENIIQERERLGDISLLKGRNIILATHGEEIEPGMSDTGKKDRFGSPAMRESIKHHKGAEGQFEHIEPKTDSYNEVKDAKDDIISNLKIMPSPLTFIFSGHGGPDAIYLTDGEFTGDIPTVDQIRETENTVKITYTELAEALKTRQNNIGRTALSEDVMIFTECYNHTFMRKLNGKLDELNCSTPIMVGSAEYNMTTSSDFESEYDSSFFEKVLALGEEEEVTFKNLWENEELNDFDTTLFIPRSSFGPIMQVSDASEAIENQTEEGKSFVT